MGSSRSLKLAPFDNPYDFLLVGHCKYSSILYHFRDKSKYWSKITIYHNPCTRLPHEGSRRNVAMIFDMEKTRMVKKFDDMSSRFGTIWCVTYRQTDTRGSIHSALCIASCGKTCIDMVTKLSKKRAVALASRRSIRQVAAPCNGTPGEHWCICHYLF